MESVSVGSRIKEKREEAGLSVDEVAKRLGKNRATVYRYESNEIENLPITVIELLAVILNTTPDYLAGWIGRATREKEDGISMNNLINITNQDGQLIVSSREIAENFEKEHNDTKKKIRELEKDMGEKSHNYFFITEYTDSMNRIQEEYLLTRDGFTLLAMGFTGSKALEWKLKYIEAFNKMEKALQEVYHISETAIVNNIMEELESKIFTSIDNRLSKYEDNYRPTHANKMNINKYIKEALGDLSDNQDVELVKQRILISLDAEAWQDVPYEKLKKSMGLIDESIRAVKSFRVKSQLSLFEN